MVAVVQLWRKVEAWTLDLGRSISGLAEEVSLQHSLEASIRLLDVELQIPRLFRSDLLSGAHLIERDEPLHDLALRRMSGVLPML